MENQKTSLITGTGDLKILAKNSFENRTRYSDIVKERVMCGGDRPHSELKNTKQGGTDSR